MAKRSSRGSNASHRRRVAAISQQELASTAPFAQVNPLTIPEVKVWLRVDQATSDVNGISSIPDAKGGSPAVQAVNAQKPTLGTTGNGFAKLVNTSTKGVTLPITTGGIGNTAWFGMGLWIKPTSIAGTGDLFDITRTGAAGLGSLDRMSCRVALDDLNLFLWLSAGNTRLARTRTDRSPLQVNTWTFVSYEFVGAEATEATRHRFKEFGTVLPAPITYVYEDSQGTAGPITSLVAATGSAILFNRTTAYANGFVGEIGPDIFFYDPTTLFGDRLIQLAQYRVPTD